MSLIIFIWMILSGLLFIVSVLLMSPKWGLWFGVWWMSTSNEYGSKKSIESTLKKSALFSVVVFTVCIVLYPYMAKKELAGPNAALREQLHNVDNSQILNLSWFWTTSTQDAINASWVTIEAVPTTWATLTWTVENNQENQTTTWN